MTDRNTIENTFTLEWSKGAQIILVSAGFDAHERDPLGGMKVTTRGFGLFAERLCAVADEICNGRIVLALEGGSDLEALGESVAETVGVLAKPSLGAAEFPVASARGMEISRVCRDAHARFWPTLGRRIQD